jgi:hypothetical protein
MIGLACYVLQASSWDESPRIPRAIDTADIDVGAWFDEISVVRLPRVRLTSTADTAVFGPDEVATLLADVADTDAVGLTAKLHVSAADGSEVRCVSVPIRTPEGEAPLPTALPRLVPGLYTASLEVRAPGMPLRSPRVTFIKLAPAPQETDNHAVAGSSSRRGAPERVGYGLVLPSYASSVWPRVASLAEQLGISEIKLPLWSPSEPSEGTAELNPGLVEFLGQLVRRGGRVVGALEADSPRSAELGLPTSLIDVLNEDPAGWGPQLKQVLARYAHLVDNWQIGTDGAAALVWDSRLARTVPRLENTMEEIISSPLLVSCWSLQQEMVGGHVPCWGLSLFAPCEVSPDELGAHFAAFDRQPYAERWITLEPLPRGRYERSAALADYAKRLVRAHATGADTVFVPPPWTVREELDRTIIEPDERLMFLRTFVSLLGGARSVKELSLSDGTQGQMFQRPGEALLVLWNAAAPQEGLPLEMYLGGAPRQVDPWGIESPVELADDKHVLRVGRMPTVVRGFDSELMLLRTSIVLEPEELEASPEEHEVYLQITNPYRHSISGQIRLIAPPRWVLEPRHIAYSLAVGETQRERFGVRFPFNEAAGPKEIIARVTLDAARRLVIDVPLSLEIGLNDVAVTVIAQVVQDRVIVRQSITSFADHPLYFEGFVVVPDQPRRTRLIPGIGPGETVIKEYDIPGVRELSGRKLRVGLREVDGNILYNAHVRVP